jgi:hypothetical protein
MQNELVNRDMDRKTSMSFGNGGFGSYLPSMQNNMTNHSLMDQSPALLPSSHNIMSSPMMNVQNPYMSMGGMSTFGGMQMNSVVGSED